LLKDHQTAAVIVRVENDAVTLPVQQIGQRMLARFDWLLAQVFVVKLDYVEGAEHSGAVVKAR
jgi:hypothetical protein